MHIRKQTLLHQRLKSLFRRTSGARHENVQERTVGHCAKEILSNSADWKNPMKVCLECLHVSLQTGDVRIDPSLVNYAWLGRSEQGIFESELRQAFSFPSPVRFRASHSKFLI